MPQPLRITYAVLSASDLQRWLSDLYFSAAPMSCHYWKNAQEGGNDLYLVESDRRKYIVRLYLSDNLHAELDAQAQLCNDLAAQGIAVPQIVAAHDGSLVQTLNAPEGSRYAAVSEFLEGSAPGSAITEQQSTLYGRTLAALHRASDSSAKTYRLANLDEETLLQAPAREIRPFIAHLPHLTTTLNTLVEQLSGKLRQLQRTSPAFGVCHGDVHKANCLCIEDRLTITDFDCAGYGWRAYDLAVFRWSTGRPPHFNGLEPERASVIWGAFLAGYQSVHPLSNADLQTIREFVLIRHLWWLAIDLRRIRLERLGRGWLNDGFFEASFQVLDSLKALPEA